MDSSRNHDEGYPCSCEGCTPLLHVKFKLLAHEEEIKKALDLNGSTISMQIFHDFIESLEIFPHRRKANEAYDPRTDIGEF